MPARTAAINWQVKSQRLYRRCKCREREAEYAMIQPLTNRAFHRSLSVTMGCGWRTRWLSARAQLLRRRHYYLLQSQGYLRALTIRTLWTAHHERSLGAASVVAFPRTTGLRTQGCKLIQQRLVTLRCEVWVVCKASLGLKKSRVDGEVWALGSSLESGEGAEMIT